MIIELQIAIAGFFVALTSILVYGLQIFKTRMASQDAQLQSIHHMVNGQRTAMLDQISKAYTASAIAPESTMVDMVKNVETIHAITAPKESPV